MVQNASMININSKQALTISKHFQIRHSYGKPICRSCRDSLTRHTEIAEIERHEKAFEWLSNITNSDDEDATDEHESHDSYKQSQIYSPMSGVDNGAFAVQKKKRETLNLYLQLCGSNKLVKTTGSYHKLQAQSKANFLGHARVLIQSIIEFLAPNNYSQLRRDLFGGDKSA